MIEEKKDELLENEFMQPMEKMVKSLNQIKAGKVDQVGLIYMDKVIRESVQELMAMSYHQGYRDALHRHLNINNESETLKQ